MINPHDIELEDISIVFFDIILGMINMGYFYSQNNVYEHRGEEKTINHALHDDNGLQVSGYGSNLQQRWLEEDLVVEVAEGGIGSVVVGLVVVVGFIARPRCHKRRCEMSVLGVSASHSRGCTFEATLASIAPSSLSSAGTSRVLLYVPMRRLYDVTTNEAFDLYSLTLLNKCILHVRRVLCLFMDVVLFGVSPPPPSLH